MKRTGVDLLRDPMKNKGLAFTKAERAALGIRGLLPSRVFDMAGAESHALAQLRSKTSPLEKYIYLQSLQDRDETMYFYLVTRHIREIMPLIYTPTVGDGCIRFGHIFRRARGLFVSLEDRGCVAELVANWPEPNVKVVVVTDGERILGLGDLGAAGMGIPIGKLNLYTACAGIHPSMCLPITLDVGTENAEFLADPFYPGLPRHRERGAVYEALIEELFDALNKRYPGVLIQFEDFGNSTAFGLLHHWQPRTLCFNDDIQGTAAVTVAGLYSATRVKGTKLSDESFLFVGAGEAGVGIADLLVAALKSEGLEEAAARRKVFLFDTKGLITAGRGDAATMQHHKKPYAHDYQPAVVGDLLEAVKLLKPSALIGVSTNPDCFTEEIIKLMTATNSRPIIFPLSNPTRKSECTFAAAVQHSDGKVSSAQHDPCTHVKARPDIFHTSSVTLCSQVLFASGSPFDDYSHGGVTLRPAQANNAYIFPGTQSAIGLISSRM
jgi:malate dehydrogenase (oxaloacetate-decarboxylating)(NADP+)